MAVFGLSARDYYLTIAPESGPRKGVGLRVKTWNKAGLDAAPKAAHGKGHRETPEAIYRGTAEPKVTLDGLISKEVNNVRNHVGGIGGYPYTMTFVATRPNVPTQKWEAKGCEWSGGGAPDIDENGSIAKIESLAMDLLKNGTSIYHKRHG